MRMDESSILQTRFQTDTEDARDVSPSVDNGHVNNEHPDGPSPTEVGLAESFLVFIDSAQSCGVPFQARLDPVQLLHTLGSGATFDVKRTMKNSVDEPSRVVKVLKHRHHAEAQRLNQSAYSALMRELAALSHPPLHNHRNVVTLHSVGCAVQSRSPLEICPALFMEEASHGTLAEFEKSGVVLGASSRRRLCLDVSEGLAAIHSCGIVHGDLKAGNILVFEDSKEGFVAKIADFGCAVFLDKYRDLEPSALVRLPGISQPWAAPEAGEPIPINRLLHTDVYSLGLLIFRILVFTDPFSVFDLPPDRDHRAAAILELRQLPKFPLLVAGYIQKHTSSQWTRSERLVFNAIFSSALDTRPQTRDLPLVVGLLRLLLEAGSGLGFDQVAQCIEDCSSTPRWSPPHDTVEDVSAALQLTTISDHASGYAKSPTELLPVVGSLRIPDRISLFADMAARSISTTRVCGPSPWASAVKSKTRFRQCSSTSASHTEADAFRTASRSVNPYTGLFSTSTCRDLATIRAMRYLLSMFCTKPAPSGRSLGEPGASSFSSTKRFEFFPIRIGERTFSTGRPAPEPQKDLPNVC